MIRVLFVCLGNICRSPIAEGVFCELVKERNLEKYISCDSAGTAAYHTGSLPDRRMRSVAEGHGIKLTHQARQLCQKDFADFHYLLAMDTSNFDHIRKESFKYLGSYLPESQLYLYRMFDPERLGSSIVPDPFYDQLPAFEEVYRIVRRSGTSFLDFLIEKHGLQGNEV
ncbi:Putative low molecular weight protein-tyrosine-phosphatase [Dyadobacter sp. CECT 9275]|uniref:protein-tyrosine-phosphatase n=1 Tax=Dyadobacter helix TaxID=2822344 RepID=A0A916J725_9BACT|nr:low molecular weight protein-tyrosine-phosphatase [Dyadobacter sp. CECT 9275]CAG4989188.1 Putative low molecular weight protein-tyrosine-phosphatase [Dyadobacter sp. CECT 9275]